MKVIIFTMAYNAEKTIRRTIESVLNQTFINFEYYILDNASTDKTEDIIFEYSKKDERIIPIHVSKNDPPNGGAFFHTLVNSTNAEFITWIDADDEYELDFLENMTNFSVENNLDIAVSGYSKINGVTGEIIKKRVLEKNLVVYNDLFTEEFIKYRGFISYLWGKLYSVKFLRSKNLTNLMTRTEAICNDSIWSLKCFNKAQRVGIYAKSMCKYYQYDNSLSHQNIEESLDSFKRLWCETKLFLQSYGPISKLNEDFLYAINLSLVDEVTTRILKSENNTKDKLEMLYKVFSDYLWKETVHRNVDPQYHNLARRKDFIDNMKNNILSLEKIERFDEIREHIFICLSGE